MYRRCLTLALLILINGSVINFSFQYYDNHRILAQTNDEPEENEAPEADDQKVSVDANDDVKITLEGKDDDKDDDIEFDIVSDPSNGKLDNFDKSDGTVTYAPDKDYSGDDDFKFKVTDDKGAASDRATVDIEVKATNQAPEADDQKVSVDANDDVKITLEGKDDDKDDDIEFDIVSDPSNGKLDNFDKSDGTVTYAPDKDYSGDDDFKFKVVDDKGAESDTADVVIEVKAVIETNQQTETTTTTGDETNQQTETTTTTGDETNQQTETTTTGNHPDMEPENQTTIQSLQNNELDTNNQSPFAYDQDLSNYVNKKVDITLTGKDDDNDPIQFAIVSDPADATLDNFDMAKGTATYSPEMDYVGNDSFSFKVIDDKGVESSVATVSVEVNENNQTNRAPQAFDQVTNEANSTDYRYAVWSAGEEEDRFIFFSRSTNGGESFSSPLSLSGKSRLPVFNPEVSSDGNNVYVVWQGQAENGNQDIFMRKSVDYGSSFSEVENLSNDPGGSGNPEVAVVGNNTHVTWEGTTPGNNFIFYTKGEEGSDFDTPQKVSSNTGISYKPELVINDYSDTDSFTYKVTDDKGTESNVATVDVNIETIEQPTLKKYAKTVSVDSNHEIDISLKANDQDNDPLQFEIVTPPSDGKLDNFDPNSGTITYVPNENNEVGISWHNYQNGQDRIMSQVVDNGDSESEADSPQVQNDDPFKANR